MRYNLTLLSTDQSNSIIHSYIGGKFKPVQGSFNANSWLSINTLFDTQAECLEYCNEINISLRRSLECCYFPLPDIGFPFYLTYHQNYNKLMPVVKKVMADLEPLEGGTSRDLQNNIRHKLETVYNDIVPVFSLCVEAICFLNEIRAINEVNASENE